MFTANTLLSFLDYLVSSLSIVLFFNLFTAIFYTSATNNNTSYDDVNAIAQLDISTIITIVTTTLHLISFLLWLNITLYYIGDITHYCTLFIELIAGGSGNSEEKRGRGVSVRRLLL